MDEVTAEFLIESHERLDRLDGELLALERDPHDREAVAEVFRTLHTIKGTCGFLGFTTLELLTHAGEHVLARLREGALALDRDVMDALLQVVDAVRDVLGRIAAAGEEGAEDHGPLLARLAQLGAPDGASEDATGDPSPKLGEVLIEHGLVGAAAVAAAVRAQREGDPRRVGEILVDHGAVASGDVEEALRRQHRAAETTVRVDVGLLDRLVELAGALGVVRDELVGLAALDGSAPSVAPIRRLEGITAELHQRLLQTHLQPIGDVWSRFPRMVRDLAAQCGKQVDVTIEGPDVELHKAIAEAVRDPLTHLVRNAVDHGLEPPQARLAAGKPPTGQLRLRAAHVDGSLALEISDDGAGMSARALRGRAVERGVLTSKQAALLPDHEVIGLVFTPGFSTAAAITNVSGRGVGMDIVWTSIARIGGTVTIRTEPGSGTTVRLTVPLTPTRPGQPLAGASAGDHPGDRS